MNGPARRGRGAIDPDRIQADIDELARWGADPRGGISRTSYSAADRAVRDWLRRRCDDLGLQTRVDGLGTVVARLPGARRPDAEPVGSGSHLDTVPTGGRYDGILGTVAALEVARCLRDGDMVLERPFEVIVFADEEGSYHQLLGSTGLVRGYSDRQVATMRGRDGDLLTDALTGMGWDPSTASTTRVDPGSWHAFVELHIEQGPVLEDTGTDIGVVTSIVGLGSGVLELTGRQDHAGTTPMTTRRDALGGAGELLARFRDLAASVSDTAVLTCGLVDVEPGGANVVPGLVRLQLDFRDVDAAAVGELEHRVRETAAQVCSDRGLTSDYRRTAIADPVPMDDRVRSVIADSASRRGLSTRELPSGAGHDSQNMAVLAPTGMIFVPSRDGRSHCPEEFTSTAHAAAGAAVLLDTVTALVTAGVDAGGH